MLITCPDTNDEILVNSVPINNRIVLQVFSEISSSVLSSVLRGQCCCCHLTDFLKCLTSLCKLLIGQVLKRLCSTTLPMTHTWGRRGKQHSSHSFISQQAVTRHYLTHAPSHKTCSAHTLLRRRRNVAFLTCTTYVRVCELYIHHTIVSIRTTREEKAFREF